MYFKQIWKGKCKTIMVSCDKQSLEREKLEHRIKNLPINSLLVETYQIYFKFESRNVSLENGWGF